MPRPRRAKVTTTGLVRSSSRGRKDASRQDDCLLEMSGALSNIRASNELQQTDPVSTLDPQSPPTPQRPTAASRPGTAVRATPSMLSLSNFKRRPRQPSILRMVQQSFGDDDEIGETGTVLLSDDDGSDLLGSTPGGSLSRSSAKSRKRKAAVMEGTEIQQLENDTNSDGSLHISSANLAHSARKMPGLVRLHTPTKKADSLSEHPPLSSSPCIPTPAEEPHLKPAPPTRRLRAGPDGRNRDTANYVSTEALRALLPKRRHRKAEAQEETFDIPSSDPVDDTDVSEESADELSRPHHRRKKATAKLKSTLSKHHRITSTTNSRATDAAEDKENDDAVVNYDSDGFSFVEIGGSNERSRTDLVESKELANAAKKFKKVDDWQLEFESCDMGGGSSSPWR